ncbi:MAG: YicC family protein [Candidatus Omnitrophica bacterium]|nr:YicC family protein [Candidatus Omnitrophota bacterium]
MIKSMTGFGTATATVLPWGRMTMDVRSINHRFLDVVFHLPPGLSCVEEDLKREIEKRLGRGRVTCAVNLNGALTQKVSVNKPLLRQYYLELKKAKEDLGLGDEISINTLVHMPGVLSVEDIKARKESLPGMKALLKKALDELSRNRVREGAQIYQDLMARCRMIQETLVQIKVRYKKVVDQRASELASPDEQNGFLKSSDITEELVRLDFHLKSAKAKLNGSQAIGKELDFVAQEMQREINTVGAKSVDAAVSGKVVQIKSEIEKIREQLQNVE